MYISNIKVYLILTSRQMSQYTDIYLPYTIVEHYIHPKYKEFHTKM